MVHFSYNFCSSFIFVHLPSSTQPESKGSILALNHKFFNASKSTCETKGSPFGFFFGTMRLFSKIFEIYQRVPPWIFLKFSVCRKRWMSLNGLFLSFSALCDLKNTFFSKKNQNFFFEKNFFFQNFPIVVPWIFLSLRYGADLGRSRLVAHCKVFGTYLLHLKAFNNIHTLLGQMVQSKSKIVILELTSVCFLQNSVTNWFLKLKCILVVIILLLFLNFAVCISNCFPYTPSYSIALFTESDTWFFKILYCNIQ